MTPVVVESFSKFPGIFTIIQENFNDMINAYLKDFGIAKS